MILNSIIPLQSVFLISEGFLSFISYISCICSVFYRLVLPMDAVERLEIFFTR